MYKKVVLLVFIFLFLLFGKEVSGQVDQIRVVMTDKEGYPRTNRTVIYNLIGINIDKVGADVPLLGNLPVIKRTIQSDANGLIVIPLPINELTEQRDKLNDSKQIRV